MATKMTSPQAKAADTSKKAKPSKSAGVSKAKALAPQLAARTGRTAKTKFRGNADIFGELVEDHDRHRALLAMIDATNGKSKQRAQLFTELVKELKAHAAAEEQALWSTILRNPETTDFARHAIAEHKQIDDLLADLAARDMVKAGWIKRFSCLKEKYLHHILEEEQEQFIAAEKQLSAADQKYMRAVFKRRKKIEKSEAKLTQKIKLKD